MKTTAAAEARLFYWHEPLHKGINGDILFVFVKRETMTYVNICTFGVCSTQDRANATVKFFKIKYKILQI